MKEHFREKGWFVFDLVDPEPLYKARSFLERTISELLGKKIPLEEYHNHVEEDRMHIEIQVKITEAYRKEGWGPKIISQQLSFFQSLLGFDLSVQANPYLRIARPRKPQDNIGFHRDTFYGGSPYELSCLIPFVELKPEESLKVLSGSHIQSEDFYPTTQIPNPDPQVTKGSAKHQLGFLYAPKMMNPSIEAQMEGIPLKLGQALVFSLSTVHGARENEGGVSRWSSDIRVMQTFAPVDLSARPTYYQPLSTSVISEQAQTYFKNNERRNDVELGLCDTAPGK